MRAAELGAGTGVVSLLMLAKDKAETVYAIEAQPEFARLTERNAEMNGLSRRLITVEADVRTVDENTLGGRVDVVFSNPPYMRADCGRENAESVKNIARREVLGGIFDFCACAARILKYGGVFYTVYRPERLPDLMEALRSSGISLSTAKRIRSRLMEMQIIEQEGETYRFKSRKWRLLLKNRGGELGSR